MVQGLPFQGITLLGHSSVGKTTLSALLSDAGWFHYSGDYRIATFHLRNEIELWLHSLANGALCDLISRDAARISLKVEVDNLAILSAYVGKLGNDGLSFDDFIMRQRAFALAEKKAMYDVPFFMDWAKKRYGAPFFINDAGGSLGEYEADEALFSFLAKHCLLVYLQADDALHEEILERAKRYPKPICYDEDFLRAQVLQYENYSGLSVDNFIADDFLRFVAPRMLLHRNARYARLAARYGVALLVREVWACRDAEDFLELLLGAFHKQRGELCR